MASTLVTVLFTDIVSSTQRAAELGNRRWREVLERHHERLRTVLEDCGGAEANTAGDAVVATFDRPGTAIRCACAIRESARELGLEVRSGLHTGEVEDMDGTVGGIAVHTGARVVEAAGPGEVLVSSTLHDVVAGLGFEFEDRGVHGLRGVPGEWRLYAVKRVPEADEPKRRFLGVPIPARQVALPVGALTVGLLVLLAVFVFRYNLDWPAAAIGVGVAAAVELAALWRLKRTSRRKQALRTVGYGGGVLTLGALGVGFATPSPSRQDVLVLPFVESSAAAARPDAEGTTAPERAAGVAGLLQEQLAQSRFLRPISSLIVNDLQRELGLGPDPSLSLPQVARLYRASGADLLALVTATAPDSVAVQIFSDIEGWRPLNVVELQRVDPEGVLQDVERSAHAVKEEAESAIAGWEREAPLESALGTGAAAYQDFLRGRQLYFFDDLQGARGALEDAVHQDSTFALAHAWLARVYDRLFDPRASAELAAAQRWAREAPGLHRDFIRANDLLVRKRHDELAKLLPELTARYDDDPETLLQLGEMYRLLEYVDPASLSYDDERLELYGRLVAAEPRNPTLRKELGLLWAQRGDWPRAEAELEQVVALNPYSADGYYNLGFLHRVLGRYDQALEAFQTADSLRPGYARDEIAFTLLELGRYAEARQHLLAGLGTAGTSPDRAIWGHLTLGELALQTGDTATASAEIENAARLLGGGRQGDDFVRLTVLGARSRLAAARRDRRELDRVIDAMHAISPASSPLHAANARRALLAGDSAAAVRDLELAVATASANEQPTYLLELGETLRDAGRLAESEAAYRRLLSQDRNSARAYHGLGLTLARSGKTDEARRELAHFLELWSGADSAAVEVHEARTALEELERARS